MHSLLSNRLPLTFQWSRNVYRRWTSGVLPAASFCLHIFHHTHDRTCINAVCNVSSLCRRWICTGTTSPTRTDTVGPVKTVSPPQASLLFTPPPISLIPCRFLFISPYDLHFSLWPPSLPELEPAIYFIVKYFFYLGVLVSVGIAACIITHTHFIPALSSWDNSSSAQKWLCAVLQKENKRLRSLGQGAVHKNVTQWP